MSRREETLGAFSAVLDYIAVPALIVSLKESTILVSNSPLIKNYGTTFSEGMPFQFEAVDGSPCFLRLLSKTPMPLFERVYEERDASFQMLPLNGAYALIFEFFRDIKSDKKQTSKQAATAAESPPPHSPFHFSYIHNFVSAARSYSQPELLLKIGLIKNIKDTLDWRSVVFKADLPLYDSTIERIRQHGGSHEMRYRIVGPGGKIIRVCDFCGLASSGGGWPVLAGSIINADKFYDDLKTAERHAFVGRLVGGMIHDFKNLLGGIQNIIEWTMKISEQQEVRDSLKKTLSYSQQAVSLLNGALKASSGKREGKAEKVNIQQLIKGHENLIRRILPSTINLEISVADNIPPVMGQKNAIQDMLLNLCINARDAMKQKGSRLKIEAFSESYADDYGAPQNFVRINVIDDGCGMSQEDARSVFDVFYTTKDTGAGLGLWMVKEAVNSFDGKIEVHSEKGRGTSMEITLPAMEDEGFAIENNSAVQTFETRQEQIQDENEKPFVLSEPKRVLYIEDDPLIRSSIASWLESLGFDIITADDGIKGIETFTERSSEIDIVIQDFILPGKRGDQLLEEIVACKPGVPVIVSSAESDSVFVQDLYDKGAYAFISKPFRMEELLIVLRKLFC